MHWAESLGCCWQSRWDFHWDRSLDSRCLPRWDLHWVGNLEHCWPHWGQSWVESLERCWPSHWGFHWGWHWDSGWPSHLGCHSDRCWALEMQLVPLQLETHSEIQMVPEISMESNLAIRWHQHWVLRWDCCLAKR